VLKILSNDGRAFFSCSPDKILDSQNLYLACIIRVIFVDEIQIYNVCRAYISLNIGTVFIIMIMIISFDF